MKTLVLFFVQVLVTFKILTPIRVARLKYYYRLRRWPDFEHPRDLNEKINWMKFYGDTSRWPLLADKYRVREYVRECGLEDCLVPLIGKWDSVEEIPWDQLPRQFVMKCNNGTGDVVICKDKSTLDIEQTKRHFRKCLHEQLSTLSGEPHYAKIKPCIIAEQLLDATTQPCHSSTLVDYKIWVFDGKPMFNFCLWNRRGAHEADMAVYDMQWNFHPEWSAWTRDLTQGKEQVPKPKCFDRLEEVAGTLGRGLPVARIDLYIVNDKVYFGEITLTSQGGYQDFYTQEFLDMAGQLTVLPTDTFSKNFKG